MIDIDEPSRLRQLCVYEERAMSQGYHFIAGVDEAGRGPLAGPVVAAACHLPQGVHFKGIDDSKRLGLRERERLFEEISRHPAVVYGIACVDAERIDELNILRASLEAMELAVSEMRSIPDFVLVDGPHVPKFSVPALGLVNGDRLSQSIAAASILAKVTRDRLMMMYHELWPMYGFDRHKGYPTLQHRKALIQYGPTSIHRKSFRVKTEDFS